MDRTQIYVESSRKRETSMSVQEQTFGDKDRRLGIVADNFEQQ